MAAMLLGVDGLSDFNGLHSHDDEVQLCAFDCLVADGDDLRRLPLIMRKTNLARILARRVDGFTRHHSNRARSAPTCSATHACSAWKGWCRSTATARTAAAGSIAGSR